jgi:hypothetical protein
MKKTNFDVYLEEQLKGPVPAERFEKAGEGWDVAIQLAALREKAGHVREEMMRRRIPLAVVESILQDPEQKNAGARRRHLLSVEN